MVAKGKQTYHEVLTCNTLDDTVFSGDLNFQVSIHGRNLRHIL